MVSLVVMSSRLWAPAYAMEIFSSVDAGITGMQVGGWIDFRGCCAQGYSKFGFLDFTRRLIWNGNDDSDLSTWRRFLFWLCWCPVVVLYAVLAG